MVLKSDKEYKVSIIIFVYCLFKIELIEVELKYLTIRKFSFKIFDSF